jgi:hypothetical protein
LAATNPVSRYHYRAHDTTDKIGLDVLRLLLAHQGANASLLASGEPLLQQVFQAAGFGRPDAADANLMLGLRAVANMFQTKQGRDLVLAQKDLVRFYFFFRYLI